MIQIAVLGLLWCAFLWFLWKRKEIPVKYLLGLLIALSLCHSTLFIDYSNLSGLPYIDDAPKYLTYTTENLHHLLAYGTPFGFNHNFQGGIPSLYLTSNFLELLPFSLIFGDVAGYQLMIVFFIVLIPVSLFFLAREITKDQWMAGILAMVSTFQLGLWPILGYGMIPALVAVPLSFFSLFFFLRYLSEKRYSLFPLVFFTFLLVYTHIVIWANTMAFFLMILAGRWIGQKRLVPLLKKTALLGFFHILTGLPLWFTFFSYRGFFRTEWAGSRTMSLPGYLLSIPRTFLRLVTAQGLLSLSILILLWLYFQSDESRAKKLFLNAFLFNVVFLFLLSLRRLPRIEFFFDKLEWMFVPYILAFNLSLPFIFKMKRAAKILGILLVAILLVRQYPLRKRPMDTLGSISEIDSTLPSFIRADDYVLLENCSHLKKYGMCLYSHWEGYLQKALGAKFFSHQGNDAHPYNALRSMYLLSGYFQEEPLGEANKDKFITQLKDWSVSKVCVWSSRAREFFDNSTEFSFLGKSDKYFCYKPAYALQPEVRLSHDGKGRIVEETPFSFAVILEDVSRAQTVTLNKNYFRFWSARDEKGRRVPLKSCGQKICFESENNGSVFFKYRKNLLFCLVALFALPLSFAFEIVATRFSSVPARGG